MKDESVANKELVLKHQKKGVRGKSKQAVQPSVCVLCVATGDRIRITESMFAVSVQIKKQYTKISTVKPLTLL